MNKIKMQYLVVEQPIGKFYIGKLTHKDILEICYSDIRRFEKREIETLTGIQRELDPKRVKNIEKYVNLIDATFPNTIILHIDEKNIEIDEESDTLVINNEKNVAKILDGQHRIAGLIDFKGKIFEVLVTVFISMDIEDQAIVFSTINKTHKQVSKSLVYDLFEYATTRSPQKTAHLIARALNDKEGSPFKDKIKILGTARDIDKETITQATFVESLMNLFLTDDPVRDRDIYKRKKKISLVSEKELLKRPFRNLFIAEKDAVIAQILWNYFKVVEEKWFGAWTNGEPDIILNRTTGFIALMRLLKDIFILEGFPEKILKKDFQKYFNKITLSNKDFDKKIYYPGSSGQSKLYTHLKEQAGL